MRSFLRRTSFRESVYAVVEDVDKILLESGNEFGLLS